MNHKLRTVDRAAHVDDLFYKSPTYCQLSQVNSRSFWNDMAKFLNRAMQLRKSGVHDLSAGELITSNYLYAPAIEFMHITFARAKQETTSKNSYGETINTFWLAQNGSCGEWCRWVQVVCIQPMTSWMNVGRPAFNCPFSTIRSDAFLICLFTVNITKYPIRSKRTWKMPESKILIVRWTHAFSQKKNRTFEWFRIDRWLTQMLHRWKVHFEKFCV